MGKTRGIVMKTSKKNTILYTEQGDYLEIKTPKVTPRLGQVIEVDLPVRKGFDPRLLKIGSIAAMLLLVIGLSLLNIVSNTNTAAAAVVMDMTSSKELIVNRDAKVLRVIDLPQGTQAPATELQGKDIYSSIDLLINQANSQGILKQGKNLVMASIIPLNNGQTNVIDPAKLRDSISQDLLKKNISADLMVSTTNEATLKTAQSLGMSVNHYLVYKRLMAMGFNVNSKDSALMDTSHMLTTANKTLMSLFPQESMAITPQTMTNQKMTDSMGKQMPSNTSPTSGSNQSQSPSNMMNTSPSSSSNQTMPANPPKSSTSATMPNQGSTSYSSQNQTSSNMMNSSPSSSQPMPANPPMSSTTSVTKPYQDSQSGSGTRGSMMP